MFGFWKKVDIKPGESTKEVLETQDEIARKERIKSWAAEAAQFPAFDKLAACPKCLTRQARFEWHTRPVRRFDYGTGMWALANRFAVESEAPRGDFMLRTCTACDYWWWEKIVPKAGDAEEK